MRVSEKFSPVIGAILVGLFFLFAFWGIMFPLAVEFDRIWNSGPEEPPGPGPLPMVINFGIIWTAGVILITLFGIVKGRKTQQSSATTKYGQNFTLNSQQNAVNITHDGRCSICGLALNNSDYKCKNCGIQIKK
jgi:hypothetical protein